MSSHTASTAPQQVRPAPMRSTLARTRLDWAIIASLLAMGTKAYASPVKTHACGAPLA